MVHTPLARKTRCAAAGMIYHTFSLIDLGTYDVPIKAHRPGWGGVAHKVDHRLVFLLFGVTDFLARLFAAAKSPT